jgi:Flp pilus assembly protein TadD
VPLAVRVANAAVSCLAYLWKAAWPSGLAPFYPLSPSLPPLWQPVAAAAVVVVISLLAIRTVRTRPYFAVGWFAYLVMLLPVIGIVQVGAQSMADRYTYLPLVGVTIAVVWGAAEAASVLARRTGTPPRPWSGGLAGAALLAAAWAGWAARHQTLYWKDGVTLWTHAVAVSDNCRSQFHLAGALADARRTTEALPHYGRAVEQCPDDASVRYFFGEALVAAGQPDRAIREYRQALQLGLRSPELLNNLGVRLALQGDAETALVAFRQAVRASPTAIEPRLNLAMLLRRRLRIHDARREYEEIVRLAPGSAAAHEGLAMTLFLAGDAAGAWREANEARRLGREPNPEFMRMLGERLGGPR